MSKFIAMYINGGAGIFHQNLKICIKKKEFSMTHEKTQRG